LRRTPVPRQARFRLEPMIVLSFWIELRGATKLWVASIFFTLLGALLAWSLPDYFPAIGQDPIASMAIRVLGWTFIGLGLLVLVPMLATLYVRARHPGQEANWYEWINFFGGLAGALAFAIPATLMFPVFLWAYFGRPNVLFPDEAAAANNLWIAALFSVIGAAVLALLCFLLWPRLRKKAMRGIRKTGDAA
jgi:hypothetical protein